MLTQDTIASVHEPPARRDAAYAPTVDTFLEPCEAGASSHEWRPAPGELASLWDMLRVHAETFVLLMKNLSDAARIISKQDDKQDSLWIGIAGSTESLLDEISKHCVSLNLESGLDQIARMRALCNLETSPSEFGNALKELANRIEDELNRRAFFFVAPDRAKFFEEEYPFGKRIANRFPSLTEDISEAAKCLAAGRFTASVFHLMRVLEAAVQRLAKLLGTTVNVKNEPWGAILKPIDDAIRNLPGGPKVTREENDRKAAFSEAAAYLRHVKDAWRNRTMHPKRTCTEDDAISIFKGVKMFMNSFVKLR
jgi:hypothetical protein